MSIRSIQVYLHQILHKIIRANLYNKGCVFTYFRTRNNNISIPAALGDFYD